MSSLLSGSTFSVPQAPTVMPSDSDMRAAVKGFSTQLRARFLQAWMTKPTTDDEYAYCRTRCRSVRSLSRPRTASTDNIKTPCSQCLSMESVCVAYNIGCSNCSVSEVAAVFLMKTIIASNDLSRWTTRLFLL